MLRNFAGIHRFLYHGSEPLPTLPPDVPLPSPSALPPPASPPDPSLPPVRQETRANNLVVLPYTFDVAGDTPGLRIHFPEACGWLIRIFFVLVNLFLFLVWRRASSVRSGVPVLIPKYIVCPSKAETNHSTLRASHFIKWVSTTFTVSLDSADRGRTFKAEERPKYCVCAPDAVFLQNIYFVKYVTK